MTTKQIVQQIETILGSPQPPQPEVVLKLLAELARNVDAIEQNVPGKASAEEIDDLLSD
jgi:hypothetical protein